MDQIDVFNISVELSLLHIIVTTEILYHSFQGVRFAAKEGNAHHTVSILRNIVFNTFPKERFLFKLHVTL